MVEKYLNKCPDLGKNYLVLHIYGLNSYLKCRFKIIFEKKNTDIFPVGPSFCLYSKKPALSQKVPGCPPVNFIFTFRSNFHPNIWVFTIYAFKKIEFMTI